MDKEIIFNKDLKKKNDVIIKDIINSLYSNKSLLRVLKYISEGHGNGNDIANLVYWSDLDEYDRQYYDKSFEKIGMELSYFDDEIIVPYDDLYYYLELAFKRYIQEILEQKEEVLNYMTKLKLIFNECKKSDN